MLAEKCTALGLLLVNLTYLLRLMGLLKLRAWVVEFTASCSIDRCLVRDSAHVTCLTLARLEGCFLRPTGLVRARSRELPPMVTILRVINLRIHLLARLLKHSLADLALFALR